MSSLPDRNNPTGDSRSGVCNAKVVGLAIVFIFTMRIWIGSVLDYIEQKESFGHWTSTNATILGVNATLRANFNDEWATTYWCPRLHYQTTSGVNIIAVGNVDCSLSMNETLELVGSEVQVRYDPSNPEDFMEQSFYDSEMKVLILIAACGVFFSIIFGFIMIRSIVTGDGITDEGEEVLTGMERQEREDLIRSKLHFQKVSSDVDISVHSKRGNVEDKKGKVCATEGVDEELGDSSSSARSEAQHAAAPSSSAPTSMFPTLAGTFAFSSKMMLSSWRRPAGVRECCICLEEYQAGEIICTAKAPECNHVFHEKCVTSWLMANHDECPLCRVNLIKG